MAPDYQAEAAVFKALGDPKRLAVLELLRSGEKCACVLLDQLELTQSGLSYHMKILVASGLVVSRQAGKWTHYRLNLDGRDRAVRLLRQLTTPEIGADCACGREDGQSNSPSR
ncbi:MAG: metalloregulator ArsR/SmtB family transcription factor [Eubacteriales bacterium]|nr:metalloregulator ArsR/SmtB family transcription factor [Eubacteriales bacterium]